MFLETLGFEVVGVPGASEVLASVRATRPDVLLQDVQMPGLDLARLVADVRADKKIERTVVLLFTADPSADEIAEAVGADGVVPKPFEEDQIKEMLDIAIAQAHAN